MQITRKIKWIVACLIVTTVAALYCNKKSEAPSKQALLSEINGYLAWHSETRLYPMNDVEAFIRGVRARAANEKPPQNMTHEQLHNLIQEAEFESHKNTISGNLKNAELFLAEVAKQPQVVCVVDKALYYKVVNEGRGPELVDTAASHFFKYKVSLPDGSELFDTRTEALTHKICLDSVIPGFAKGVMGMKPRERRLLYIHPNLGFRNMHWTVPPNMVLVIDVEFQPQDDLSSGNAAMRT